MDKTNSKGIGLVLVAQATGGALGGIGSYHFTESNQFARDGYLGILAGIIGASLLGGKIASLIKKDHDLSLDFVVAIACGLTYQKIITSIFMLVNLQSRVALLQEENIDLQENHIARIEEIANVSSSIDRKEIAIEEYSQIAETTDNNKVLEKAITATDNTAIKGNYKIKLVAIEEMLGTALTTDNPEIVSLIKQNLKEYTKNQYHFEVNEQARIALKKLEYN